MTESEPEKRDLPFNNLYLKTGAGNGENRWWMYLVGICLTILGYFIGQCLIVLPLLADAYYLGIEKKILKNPELLFNAETMGIGNNLMLALLMLMFVFAFLGLRLAITRIHKKSFLSVVTAYEKIRFGRVFFAFGVWGFLIVTLTLIGYYMEPEEVTVQFDPGNFFLLLVVSVIFMPIQTGTEELIFRGYLVQGLSLVFKNGLIPIIITSLLFGLVHMDNPEARAHGWMIMLPYYVLFGFFFGMLTLLDEGLELAIGIHLAHNLISSLLVTSPNGVIKTDAIFMVKSEDPGSELLSLLILASITFTIFWLRYRWKNFNLILK
jgi:hypothetical protein